MRAAFLSSWLCLVVACTQETVAPRDTGVDQSPPVDASDAPDVPPDVAVDALPVERLPPCGEGTPLALSQCVEGARYQSDLETVAVERPPSSERWQAVQDLCASRLTSLGFTVERHAYATGVNVVGVREGSAEPARRVLVGAHYDHVRGCAGADDNASGVAGLLEVARVLSRRSYPRTLVVACWDEEERGLLGSRAYAARSSLRGESVEAYFNFEMIGYADHAPGTQRLPAGLGLVFPAAAREYEASGRRGDFLAAIGDERSSGALAELERYADRLGFPFIPLPIPDSLLASPLLADLRRSDHAAFWEQGFPGVMLTDTSEFRYDRYHCTRGPDVPANLDQAFAARVVAVTVAATASALGLSP